MNLAEKVEHMALSRQKAMNDVIDRGDSAVQQFYCGAAVFVTGGSGFFGKQLIEKLFRSCQLKKMYLLLRQKKGKMMMERLELMLKDPVFDMVREKQPHFADRIVPVEGDVADLKLGLSDKDWIMLTEEVDTIFHVAASVRFDEPLRAATLTNVRGTREALALAKECKLKNFVHVSTAFCHATYSRIDKEVLEQFYPAPVLPDVLIGLAESVDETRLNDITLDLIKGWPNTYTFTKAVAEEVVRTTAGDLPVCVVRPPAVACCYNEPSPGWIDMSCVYAASGFVLGTAVGVVHVANVDKYKKLNIVPLDIVNNTIIAAAWDSAERRKRNSDTTVPVYTVANEKTAITFDLLAETMRNECIKFPSTKTMWYCFLIEIKNRAIYNIIAWFLHYIPAYAIDGARAMFRLKLDGMPSLVKVYKNYDKLLTVNKYFLSNEFAFKDDNVKALIGRMSEADKAIFNCNLSSADFREFVKVWALGIRKYIIKDGLKDSEWGYKRQKILRVVNYVFMALYFYLIFYVCVSIVKFVVQIVI